ncbi:uncharacterized protein LOC121104444 isoform X2 [Ursus maritimus]|uniref:Uncharacterized protein LOC121104444 isoform X2 n=1 Tax=Ursus maritimus TaxID=29073 RepID=A0A8M1GFS2_URSMA|nr:uncharacterized protein LOC121104444 isoform X2 [Ursus maritimus]XP_040493577.1 uncharacterized protein LOC121104444 isoform X2 [Ursus maritimus]
MGGGLLQSLHIPDKTSGAQSPSQPPADPVGACAPGGPARVCCGYFRLAEWGSQQAHTRKGQFLPSHLGGTLGDWPPIQDCGSPAPSTAVSAQWAPWTEEALEWPPCCEETLAAHGEAPVEPTKRPPTLRSDDFPVNSPANAPAMGVRHLGSRLFGLWPSVTSCWPVSLQHAACVCGSRSLVAGATKGSRLILCRSSPRPTVSRRSEELPLLLLENGLRNQGSGGCKEAAIPLRLRRCSQSPHS